MGILGDIFFKTETILNSYPILVSNVYIAELTHLGIIKKKTKQNIKKIEGTRIENYILYYFNYMV